MTALNLHGKEKKITEKGINYARTHGVKKRSVGSNWN